MLHVLSSLYSAHCASLEIMFNSCVVIEMCYFLTTPKPICLSMICLTYILYFLSVGWGKSIYKIFTSRFPPWKKKSQTKHNALEDVFRRRRRSGTYRANGHQVHHHHVLEETHLCNVALNEPLHWEDDEPIIMRHSAPLCFRREANAGLSDGDFHSVLSEKKNLLEPLKKCK